MRQPLLTAHTRARADPNRHRDPRSIFARRSNVISTISGGSFTGAFYTLYGLDSLPAFERRFLNWNAERTLKRELLTPALIRLGSPNFSRSDLAAEAWDKRLFDGAKFKAILSRRKRPYLIVNATDMALGAPFSFTQEQFDPMCDELSEFPIARAVAASSAFPGLLTPITIEKTRGVARSGLLLGNIGFCGCTH